MVCLLFLQITIFDILRILFLLLVISVLSLNTWPKNFVYGQVLFSFACMCLCVFVCLSVFPSLYWFSQKVLDWFRWTLVGWCIMIKERFLLKMRWTVLVEHIHQLFEWLKLPFLTKFLGKFLKTLQNSAFLLSFHKKKISLKKIALIESIPQ